MLIGIYGRSLVTFDRERVSAFHPSHDLFYRPRSNVVLSPGNQVARVHKKDPRKQWGPDSTEQTYEIIPPAIRHAKVHVYHHALLASMRASRVNFYSFFSFFGPARTFQLSPRDWRVPETMVSWLVFLVLGGLACWTLPSNLSLRCPSGSDEPVSPAV